MHFELDPTGNALDGLVTTTRYDDGAGHAVPPHPSTAILATYIRTT